MFSALPWLSRSSQCRASASAWPEAWSASAVRPRALRTAAWSQIARPWCFMSPRASKRAAACCRWASAAGRSSPATCCVAKGRQAVRFERRPAAAPRRLQRGPRRHQAGLCVAQAPLQLRLADQRLRLPRRAGRAAGQGFHGLHVGAGLRQLHAQEVAVEAQGQQRHAFVGVQGRVGQRGTGGGNGVRELAGRDQVGNGLRAGTFRGGRGGGFGGGFGLAGRVQ